MVGQLDGQNLFAPSAAPDVQSTSENVHPEYVRSAKLRKAMLKDARIETHRDKCAVKSKLRDRPALFAALADYMPAPITPLARY